VVPLLPLRRVFEDAEIGHRVAIGGERHVRHFGDVWRRRHVLSGAW
jgi:hypothetical protein